MCVGTVRPQFPLIYLLAGYTANILVIGHGDGERVRVRALRPLQTSIIMELDGSQAK